MLFGGKTDGDKTRLKLIRRKVTRLVKLAKRSYLAKFLNPSLPPDENVLSMDQSLVAIILKRIPIFVCIHKILLSFG
jgi:hypothetical protein